MNEFNENRYVSGLIRLNGIKALFGENKHIRRFRGGHGISLDVWEAELQSRNIDYIRELGNVYIHDAENSRIERDEFITLV